MKKGIVAGLIILCVALGAGTAAVIATSDRKGPEIEIPSGADVTYEEGSDTASLLEGVTATDDKDGDVTDSLVIENIFPNDERTSASVVYAAKDNHNNVSKATRRVLKTNRRKSGKLPSFPPSIPADSASNRKKSAFFPPIPETPFPQRQIRETF